MGTTAIPIFVELFHATKMIPTVVLATQRTVARQAIANSVGISRIRTLHRPILFIDIASVIAAPAAAVINSFYLGTIGFGLAFLILLLVQAILLFWIAYLMHELVHRRWAGLIVSRVLAWCFGVTVLHVAGIYASGHLKHHRWLGSPTDLSFQRFFDTRWKRFLLLTPIGLVLGSLPGHNRPNAAEQSALTTGQRAEVVLFAIAWLVLLFLSIRGFRFISFGLVVPLLTIMPVLNAVRLILEHAEINLDLGAHCATYYRTGPILRLIFLAGAGDCHLVHHLFPTIPFYRMPSALRLLRPIIIELGAVERRSLTRLMVSYFLKGERYGTVWQSA